MGDQTATMMIVMVAKSAEISVRLAAKSAQALVRMAAFLTSMWKKASLQGKVKMAKLLKEGGSLSAVAMSSKDYAAFEKIAKEQRLVYNAAHRADNETYLITMKTEDLQRMQTSMQFYGVEVTAEATEAIIDPEGPQELSKYGNEPEVSEPTDAVDNRNPDLEETEIELSEFEDMVTANKDNSPEMEAVNKTHFPNLKEYENLRVSEMTLEEYKKAKAYATQEKIPFAPVVKDGSVSLAYRAKDMTAMSKAVGRVLPYKDMVTDAELKNRQMAREAKMNTPLMENVTKDEVASSTMSEMDEREAEALGREIEANKQQAEFASRKEEVLKENGGTDFEAWTASGADMESMPDNLCACWETQQEVLDKIELAEWQDKASALGEADAVKNLKESNILHLSDYTPGDTLVKDVEIEGMDLDR